MTEPQIVVHHLSKAYRVPKCEPSEVIGFIGPNGGAKMTTLKMRYSTGFHWHRVAALRFAAVTSCTR